MDGDFHCYSCRMTKKAEALSTWRSPTGRMMCMACQVKASQNKKVEVARSGCGLRKKRMSSNQRQRAEDRVVQWVKTNEGAV